MEVGQDLSCVEANKPFLVGADLVDVDAINPCVDVLLDLLDVALRISSTASSNISWRTFGSGQ